MNYRITDEDFDRNRFSSDERMTTKRERRQVDDKSRERNRKLRSYQRSKSKDRYEEIM